MKIGNSFKDFCYPIPISIDSEKLNRAVDELFVRLGLTRSNYLSKLLSPQSPGVSALNITHDPSVTGIDRVFKWNGKHGEVIATGGNEKNFTKPLDELEGLYISDVMQQVFDYHEKTFGEKLLGRCQLISSCPGFSYPMHYDYHSTHRYHVPVVTDNHFFFMFAESNDDLELVHMPADGRIWYLNPRSVQHTVIHVGQISRTHLLLSGY